MKRILILSAILVCLSFSTSHAVEQDADANGLIDVNKGGLNALPTADTQLLQATGVGTFGWAAVIDDAKGNGHTEYLWSADKVFDQLALKINLTALDDTKGNGDTTFIWSADKAFDQLALKLNATAIDDTKGNGHTTFVWSADKSFDQLALKIDLTALDDTKGNGDATFIWSANKVFDQLALKVDLTAIDDTKGSGDLTYLWSADKVFDQLALKVDLTAIDDTKGDGDATYLWSADKVFDQLALKQNHDNDLDDLADGSLTGSKVGGSKVTVASKAADYTIGTDSADELYGGTIYVSGAATITAPAIAAGMNFTVITIGAVAVNVDVNAADRMYLDGTALADGDKATNGSLSGDALTCQFESADGWYCRAVAGTWTDGN